MVLLSIPAFFLMPIELISNGEFTMKIYENTWKTYINVYFICLFIDLAI